MNDGVLNLRRRESAEEFAASLYHRGITFREMEHFTKYGYIVATLKNCRFNQCKALASWGCTGTPLAGRLRGWGSMSGS